jgi:hypothetical protein
MSAESRSFCKLSLTKRPFIIQNDATMFEKRKNVRYPTLARARIPEVFEGEAMLKDLSITGCCVEYTMFMDIKPDTHYKVHVTPDSASEIGSFELEVESRWVRAGGYSCEVGFAIIMSPKGKEFMRYVDYLAWRPAAT